MFLGHTVTGGWVVVETSTAAQVINPYRLALEQAERSARAVAQECDSLLDAAMSAMKAHAWVSTSGDAFNSELTRVARDAGTCGEDGVQAIRAVLHNQPERVDAHAWQTRWQRVL